MKYMYILSITILWQFKTMKLVISNKTLKRCKIAHCKKVIVMISTKTIYGYSNRAIHMILATIKYRMKKINYIPDISVLFNHHKSLIQRCKINYVY